MDNFHRLQSPEIELVRKTPGQANGNTQHVPVAIPTQPIESIVFQKKRNEKKKKKKKRKGKKEKESSCNLNTDAWRGDLGLIVQPHVDGRVDMTGEGGSTVKPQFLLWWRHGQLEFNAKPIEF